MNFIPTYRKIGWTTTGGYMLTAFVSLCLNALIPLSLGSIPWGQASGESAKGKLLQMLGIAFSSMKGFMLFFASLILLKTILVIIERWMQQHIRYRALAIGQESILHNAAFTNESSDTDYTKKAKAIRNFIVKVMFRMPPDVLYFSALVGGLALISIPFSLMTLGMFVTAMLSTSWLHRKQPAEEQTKSSSRTFRQLLKRWSTIRLFDQIGFAHDEISSATREDEKQQLQKTRTQALLQGWLTLLFYGNMMLILGIAVQHPGAYNTADILSFVLLLLYMQSTYKRIGRNSAVYYAHREDVQWLNTPNRQPVRATEDIANWILSLPQSKGAFTCTKPTTGQRNADYEALKHQLASQGKQLSFIDAQHELMGSTMQEALCIQDLNSAKQSSISLLSYFLDLSEEESVQLLESTPEPGLLKKDPQRLLNLMCVRALCSRARVIWFNFPSFGINAETCERMCQKMLDAPIEYSIHIIVYEDHH